MPWAEANVKSSLWMVACQLTLKMIVSYVLVVLENDLKRIREFHVRTHNSAMHK